MLTKDEYSIYFQWSSMTLLGNNPMQSDRYLKENLLIIKHVAGRLLNLVDYTPKEIYRGVIMPEPIKFLIPNKNMTYLSFSENKHIAYTFGSTGKDGFGAQLGLNHLLGSYGYVITYTPRLDEILFHHDFIKYFPYKKVWESIGIGKTDKTLDIQKEVTILQPVEPFRDICNYKEIQ